MSEDNSLTVALRVVFGPLVEQTSKLPAPLAYGAALVLAILVIVLLGATLPNNLILLLAVVILASLAAFVFTDWGARRRQIGGDDEDTSLGNEFTSLPHSQNDVDFEEKIEIQIRELNKICGEYDQGRGETIPSDTLLSALRPLFNRKTFDLPIPCCPDENWQDRLCAVVQIEYILRKYRVRAKAAAEFEQDEKWLLSYEEVQKELGRYGQGLTGLFQPRPQVADVDAKFLAKSLNEKRSELRAIGIHPKGEISKPVIDECEEHRNIILQEVRKWPVIPGKDVPEPPHEIFPKANKPENVVETLFNDDTKLHAILEDRFSSEELRTLCFDLGVDYDSLPGEGKSAKARELISHQKRRNGLGSLIDLIRHERGDIL